MSGVAAQPFDRAYIDDVSSGLPQMGQRGFGQQKRRRQVDRQIALPIFKAHVFDRRVLHHACVVNQNVQTPCPVDNL